MPILSTEALGHAFVADELYHEVSVAVEARDRIGLVGPNGVGKTTLLLNLAGLLEPTAGTVSQQAGLTLGYLRQEAVLTFAGRDNTVYEEMLTVFAALRTQEAEMRAQEAALAAGDHSTERLAEYGRLQEAYELAGGYQYQNQIKHVLMGLGFESEEWDMPLMHLSGGQKTRVLLGRLLLEKPELLILDEPTNHLDVGAVEWLEATLRRWEGALILVSHDRYFLDRVANRIWELAPTTPGEPAELAVYKGNYTSFVAQRGEAWERAQRLFTEEKERLEREAEFIQRHIAGGQTDIAKGRLRQLSRDLALIEQVGVVQMGEMRRNNQSWLAVGERIRGLTIGEAIQQIRALRPPGQRPPRLSIQLQAAERSGRLVLRGRQMTIGYPDAPLFSAELIRLERGDRVALIGPNGSGKTTLLKTILDELRPLAGEFDWGEGVLVGYFAQAHDQLNHDLTVLEQFLEGREMTISDARSLLAHYLFRGDDVFKPIRSLSGGERGRLALSLLAQDGANLLLLDEPTNHLDIPSQEVLQEVLETYPGTILMVSHDRYLVDRLATQIWSLEDGQLVVFPGTYAEYRGRLEQPDGAALAEALVADTLPPPIELPVTPPEAAGAPEADSLPPPRRLRPDELRRRRALQERIDDAEDWLARIHETLDELREEGNAPRAAEIEAEMAVAEEELNALLDELQELS
jgi:ATP-binding cassette subfamily F protein 3